VAIYHQFRSLSSTGNCMISHQLCEVPVFCSQPHDARVQQAVVYSQTTEFGVHLQTSVDTVIMDTFRHYIIIIIIIIIIIMIFI